MEERKFESSLNLNNIKHGEYIGLLFKALDSELLKTGFQFLFVLLFHDEYYCTILPKSEISIALKIKQIENELKGIKCNYKISEILK